MLGFVGGQIVGPIKVGGKGELSDNEVKLADNRVELFGLSYGPDDPMCCPSVPKIKKFEVSQKGFREIRP